MNRFHDIPGFVRKYAANMNGQILSHTTNKILKPYKVGGDYLVVDLGHDKRNKYVHRIVAECFIPNPYNKKEVDHIDMDKNNNCVTNLEWVTPKENVQRSFAKKTPEQIKGYAERCRERAKKQRRFTDEDIKKMRWLYLNGQTQVEIARQFNVKSSIVSRIINRKLYAEI